MAGNLLIHSWGNLTSYNFSAEVLTPIGKVSKNLNYSVYEHQSLNCAAAIKPYQLNISYENSLQNVTVAAGEPRILTNNFDPMPLVACPYKTCPCCEETPCNCLGTARWNKTSRDWFHDLQVMGLIDAVASSLAGGYQVLVGDVGNFHSPDMNISIEENGQQKAVSLRQQYISDIGDGEGHFANQSDNALTLCDRCY